jgi:hypothetical protein
MEQSLRPSREEIERLWLESANVESSTYAAQLPSIYRQALQDATRLYDKAAELTRDFTAIGAAAVVAHPSIVKILRFMTAPTSSQMKLGQILGVDSTERFESGRSIDTDDAARLVEVVMQNLETERFPWRTSDMGETELDIAKRFARLWTCSLIANENAITAFRNWRKATQERRIQDVVQGAGYKLSPVKTPVTRVADVARGEYSCERKIAGHPVQKADFVLALDRGTLFALEAKAVGVKLDATKRMKEIRNKAAAWRTEFGRQIATAAVIAGWVTPVEVESLLDEGIEVYWEHRLEKLAERIARPQP